MRVFSMNQSINWSGLLSQGDETGSHVWYVKFLVEKDVFCAVNIRARRDLDRTYFAQLYEVSRVLNLWVCTTW